MHRHCLGYCIGSQWKLEKRRVYARVNCTRDVVSSRAKCIRCCYCDAFFSPNKFIFHYHRTSDSSSPAVYNHPDAANFNSWRRHLKLVATASTPSTAAFDFESRLHAWEDVKAMFNGGSRRRIHHQHQQNVSLSVFRSPCIIIIVIIIKKNIVRRNKNERVSDMVSPKEFNLQ